MKRIKKKQKRESWSFGVFEFSQEQDPQDLFRLGVVLTESAEIVAFEPLPRQDDRARYTEWFAEILLDYGGAVDRVQVDDLALVRALRQNPQLAELRIQHDVKAPWTRMVRSELIPELPPIGASLTGTHHQVERLTEAARRIAVQEPWEAIGGDELLEIRGEDSRVTHPVVSVLGEAGEIFGLMFYGSLQTYEDYLELARTMQPPSEELMERMDVFGVWYDLDEMVSTGQREAFEREGLPHAPDAYPTFMHVTGAGPSDIETDAEAEELAIHVEIMVGFFEQLFELDTVTPLADLALEVELPGGAAVTVGGAYRQTTPS